MLISPNDLVAFSIEFVFSGRYYIGKLFITVSIALLFIVILGFQYPLYSILVGLLYSYVLEIQSFILEFPMH